MPPLREPEGDVVLLARAFLHRYAAEHKKKITGFTRQALQALEAHFWSGNARELENRIKRAVIMAQTSKMGPEDLQLTSKKISSSGLRLREALEAVERKIIVQALSRNRGNMIRVAEELGVSRPTIYELMEKLGIRRN